VSGAPGSGQLPLALRFPPDQRLDTFVATDPVVLPQLRALAVSAPAQCVLVAGGANTGKTHLAIAVCAEAGTRGIAAAYLPLASAAGRLRAALEAMEEHDLIVLDGVEAIAGHRDEEVALFDFHNRARDAGKALLYTAREWPADLPLQLPDLRSRLSQCLRIALAPLDDGGRREMLQLRARRRGLQFDPAAIDWLLRRVDRDLGSLAALFERLDRASLAAQRRVTVPFLRETLGDLG